MEYEINRGVSKTELNIKVTKSEQFDVFRYRMIKENRIEGILPCIRSQLNEVTVYTYDITGMQSVTMHFDGKKFTKSEIQGLYLSVITILLRSEEYFLDKNCFLLSEESIQYDEAKGTYQLIYCPEAGTEMKGQLADLTEYILNHTDYADKAAVALIYEVFRMMRDEHTTLLEILEYIKSGKKQIQPKPNPIQRENVCQPKPMISPAISGPPLPENNKSEPIPIKKPVSEQQEKTEKEGSFSAKKVMGCVGVVVGGIFTFLALYISGVLFIPHTRKLEMSKFGGVLLLISAVAIYICYKIFDKKEEGEKSQAKPQKEKPKKEKVKKEKPVKEQPVKEQVSVKPDNQPVRAVQPQYNAVSPPEKKRFYYLIAEKEKSTQQFILYKFPYLLGKSSEQVDGVIYSDAVSKVHAEFLEEQGNLYLLDMSSTNGTYVNNRRITSNEKVPVKIGDHIQIADKEYLLSF